MPENEPPKTDGEQFNQKLDKTLKKNNIKGLDVAWVKRYLKEWYEENIKGK